MKYKDMIKFMNDNGILLMQAIIADGVDSQLPLECDISEEKYEGICETIYQTFLENLLDPVDFWDLIDEELKKQGLKN